MARIGLRYSLWELTGFGPLDASDVLLPFNLDIARWTVPDGYRVDGRGEAEQGTVDGGGRDPHDGLEDYWGRTERERLTLGVGSRRGWGCEGNEKR